MINYIEKGYAMHEWLASQGVDLVNRDGVFVSNVPDEQVNQLIADYNPWPAEKAAKLADINEAFAAAVAQLTQGIPQAEKDSWPVQVSEAYGLRPISMLQVMASARGIELDTLIQKVKTKESIFSQHYGALQGMRDALEDLIKTLPDSGEINRLPELWAIKFGN